MLKCGRSIGLQKCDTFLILLTLLPTFIGRALLMMQAGSTSLATQLDASAGGQWSPSSLLNVSVFCYTLRSGFCCNKRAADFASQKSRDDGLYILRDTHFFYNDPQNPGYPQTHTEPRTCEMFAITGVLVDLSGVFCITIKSACNAYFTSALLYWHNSHSLHG